MTRAQGVGRGPLRSATAALLACSAIALGTCGGDDSEPEAGASGVSGATGVAGAIPEGAVPVDGPPDPDLTVEQVAAALPLPGAVTDNDRLKEIVDGLIAAPHKYFSETLEDSGEDYHLPDRLVAYDGANGDPGPDCGGTPAGLENAAYCRWPGGPEHGIIAWDETGLIEPLFDKYGDGSTAFILGHEFAHLFQDQFGILSKFPLTVERELNADCLTGSYLGAYRDKAGVEYSRRDMQSLIDGITVVGDAPGTPWQNIHAHGSGEQRQQAFFLGFDRGINQCLTQLRPGFSG